MRRCPVCDFIYEDDDKLCAMDGTGLVNHSGPLAFEESALPQLPQLPPPANSHGRGLTLIASGVILALALLLYFHSVSRRNIQSDPGAAKTYNSSSPADRNPAAVIPVEAKTPIVTPSPTLNSTPEKTDAPRKSYRARQLDDHDPFRAVPVESATPLPRPLPSFTPARAKVDVPSDKSVSSPLKPTPPLPASVPSVTPKNVKPTDNNQKNESKITSFFKKAGRVLKKPFKH
jgi:hypothetical protein